MLANHNPAGHQISHYRLDVPGRASAIRATGMAEAEVIKAQGIAETEAMGEKAVSWKEYNQAP